MLQQPVPEDFVIATGRQHSVREFVELAGRFCEAVRFTGRLAFDSSKPDGAPRKLLDVSRWRRVGWQPRIGLREGLAATYRWYLQTR